MENEIELKVENGVGIIALNRPKAINALTPNMILSVRDVLLAWASDENVRAVLFEGRGERGFCAGGDVRWTREVLLRGDYETAFKFFALEYEMNHLIATFNKPIVALTHGVVMGGGIGLAGHARYRIAHRAARFAMPEAAIGFFCDVGVRYLLAQVLFHRALMFMLAGTLVGVDDAIALNLADVKISPENFMEVRAALIGIGAKDDVDKAIKAVMARYGEPGGQLEFCGLADKNKDLFEGDDCVAIYSNLARKMNGEAEIAEIASIILGRCPTSNWVHVAGLYGARRSPDIADILKTDLQLAHLLAVRGDFIEGVRAVLVDKDHAPVWHPGKIEEVYGAEIVRALL